MDGNVPIIIGSVIGGLALVGTVIASRKKTVIEPNIPNRPSYLWKTSKEDYNAPDPTDQPETGYNTDLIMNAQGGKSRRNRKHKKKN